MKNIAYPIAKICFIGICLVWLTACASSAKPVALTISSGLSLKDPTLEISKLYAKENPNVSITFNAGGPGFLQEQIERGAPVDIFISTSYEPMDALQAKGLVLADTRQDFMENKMVLIAPKNSTAIANFPDLASNRVKKVALGEPKNTPAGTYAKEVLDYFKISGSVLKKAIFSEYSAQVTASVESGNADAGIAYFTDAKQSSKVKIVAFAPPNAHTPFIYTLAIVKNSKHIAEAREFIKFMLSDISASVFVEYGFTMLHRK